MADKQTNPGDLRGTLNMPEITLYQQAALFSPHRFAIIEATTKAGKTLGAILWMLTMAGNAPAHSSLSWVAPVFDQSEIAFRRVCQMLTKADAEQKFWSSNQSKMVVTLAGDKRLVFRSADKPDSLYGDDNYAAVIDEASRCKEESFHAVMSTLTATGGRLRIIGNVRGRKNWSYRLARKVEQGEMPDWHYAKITYRDAIKSRILKQDDINAARAVLPEAVFRELYEAEASEDGSNPFGFDHIRNCTVPLSTLPPVAFGIDVARKRDWTVVIGLDCNGRVCVFERWQHVPWKETIDRMAALVAARNAVIDGTGVGDAVTDSMQRVCPNVEPLIFTVPSKQRAMEGLAVDMQSGNVGFPDGQIRLELESIEYEYTRTGVVYIAPEGFPDDCAYALAMAAKCRRDHPVLTFSFTGRAETVAAEQYANAEAARDDYRIRWERGEAMAGGRY